MVSFLVALAVTACGGAPDADTAPNETPAASVSAPAPPERESPIAMEPLSGPPGAEVTLAMSGLMMNQATEVGFGTLVGHEIIAEAQAGTTGEVTTTVRVPESATPGTYYFFIAEANGSPLAVSDSFVVTPRPSR